MSSSPLRPGKQPAPPPDDDLAALHVCSPAHRKLRTALLSVVGVCLLLLVVGVAMLMLGPH